MTARFDPTARGRLTRRSQACLLLVLIGLAPASGAGAQTAPHDLPPAAPAVPLPPPRPDRPPELIPPPRPAEPSPAIGLSDDTPCAERLRALNVRFETRPPLHEGECRGDDLVQVSGFADGVDLSPSSLMTCPLAESLARWMSEQVAVEAQRHLETAPTKILIGTSYQCRNQRSGTKLSEHAFANGVDVIGFAFSGHHPNVIVTARPDDTPEGAFQRAVRTGACTLFTTVLGPGSDADHGDHLHLDMRGRKGGYRICQ